MIKKTAFVFIILFGIYTLILMLNPKSSVSQHQWQENIVKGEKYIYDQSDSLVNVITGSSLACRILTDSLYGFYNLSFAGQSFYDGLEIIKLKKKIPKNVFIEMNKVFISPNKEFSTDLFSKLPYNAKKYCIALRSDKQPLAFIYPLIQEIFSKDDKSVNLHEANQPSTNQGSAIFNKMLNMQKSDYSKIPDSDFVNKQFYLLNNYVIDLKAKGVNIIFFEMPLNPALVELPLSKFIREKFYLNFSPKEYKYIDLPDCSNYNTTDGLHLNDTEALWYSAYFKNEAKKY